MAGIRKKPIHPFIRSLMDKSGFTELAAFARHIGVEERFVYQLADSEIDIDGLKKHYSAAKALGVSLDEYAEEYLAG